MRTLPLLVASAVAAYATDITGTSTLTPGYVVTDDAKVLALAMVTLSGPGNYTARSWDVAGTLILPVAGDYILTATTGTIGLTVVSSVRGPATGTATLRLATTRAISVTGSVAPNVTIIQGNAPEPLPAPPLVNMSVRATLSTGQTITPAFVVGGTIQRRVLIRAIGPTLASFGVTSPLATPTFTVFSGSTMIGGNAGWAGNPALAATFSSVGAFALPETSRDAAAVLTLSPGNYTAIVGGGAGEVLLELYFVE